MLISAPQLPQKRKSSGLVAPHAWHVDTSRAPHEPQKPCPGSLRLPHRGQGCPSAMATGHSMVPRVCRRKGSTLPLPAPGAMMEDVPSSRVNVPDLQAPLRDRYRSDPDAAPMKLSVRSGPSDLADPLHCAVRPDAVAGVEWPSGAHAAVGGAGDVACSADLLLGALVACPAPRRSISGRPMVVRPDSPRTTGIDSTSVTPGG